MKKNQKNNPVSGTFKGRELKVGDMLEIFAKSVPLPSFPATVFSVRDGELDVFSTILAPFKHSGHFTESDVLAFEITYPAEEAVPRETFQKFSLNDQATVTVAGEVHSCRIVAAFNQIVVGQVDDGKALTGGMSHFHLVK